MKIISSLNKEEEEEELSDKKVMLRRPGLASVAGKKLKSKISMTS